jgi:hypothetical protein
MKGSSAGAIDGNWFPLLLCDPSACLRWLVLRHLLNRPANDPEVTEIEAQRDTDPLAIELIGQQEANGSWPRSKQVGFGDSVQRTAQALMRLGYLGFDAELPAVARGAHFLFSAQADDGSWPLHIEAEKRQKYGKYDQIPLQAALPLRGLAACGYATHPDSEHAYDWLLSTRLDDGAWPTGYVAGSYGYVAGYRRLAHSRWGCRSNTTAALFCLALHPVRRHGPEASRGLDLLLGRETGERQLVGFDVARTVGFEPARGFFTYYGAFDLALILKLCSQIGATVEDERVARIKSILEGMQGALGLWHYAEKPAVSRWITYDIQRSLLELDGSPDWTSMEPRIPFTPYPPHDTRH